jgi:ribosomal protein S18 acetylase RimI-like enzyme
MYWLHPLPPHEEATPELLPEDMAVAREYGVDISVASEPAPAVEARELFRRLYGEPQDCGQPNPYLAACCRLRAKARSKPGDGQRRGEVVGSIEYRCWPSLGLGYIGSVHVSSQMRRRGLGVRLVSFAVEHMRRRGAGSIYAFTVSREGYQLFHRAGFAPKPPDDPRAPWRRWVLATPSR